MQQTTFAGPKNSGRIKVITCLHYYIFFCLKSTAYGNPKLLSLGHIECNKVDMFVCFVVLRSKSTAMVMVGWSVHLTTLFPGQA